MITNSITDSTVIYRNPVTSVLLCRRPCCASSLSRVQLFVTPQNPWGFSRQGYWSGLPHPPPGDLLNPGSKPRSPRLQADSLPSEPPEKPRGVREEIKIPQDEDKVNIWTHRYKIKLKEI